MPTRQVRHYEDILPAAIASTVARTRLTDATDSSVVKHLLAAFARETDSAYYQLARLAELFDLQRASGEDLDERAKELVPTGLARLGALRAVGTLTFGRQTATLSAVSIPVGTQATDANGVVIRTTALGQIAASATASASIAAVADVPGSAGNIALATATRFRGRPPGVDTVTNNVTFTTGRDLESDDAFRQRIYAFVASLARCDIRALEFVAVGVEDDGTDKSVASAHVFEDPVELGLVHLYIDDGAGTAETSAQVTTETLIASALGGEEYLSTDYKPIRLESPIVVTRTRAAVAVILTAGTDYLVNPASGRFYFTSPLLAGDLVTATYRRFTGLIEEVQKVIDGDPNDRLNYPGWRAAGVLVRVLSPEIRQITVEATLNILEGYTASTVIAAVSNAVSTYINTLPISGDVVRNEILERIMATDGVYDANLISPVANTVINDDQLARIIAANLDIS